MISSSVRATRVVAPRASVAARDFHSSSSCDSNIRDIGVRPTAVSTGGRHSSNGLTTTVFGATGFMGRYVVHLLGNSGTSCFLPYRGPEEETRHLKVMGDYGKLAMVPYSIRDRKLVRKLIEESDVVINMIGKHYDTKHIVGFGDSRVNYAMEEVHVGAARTIAEECAMVGGDKRLIHVSALGADEEGSSRWSRSKAKGEAAVRSVYPDATIVRPATLFGSEDRFLNWYATWITQRPFCPLINGGGAKLQPVYVGDVAMAIDKLVKMDAEEVAGKTYELVGPEAYTTKEVVEFVLEQIRSPTHNIKDFSPAQLEFFATLAQVFPDPWITPDQALRMEEDALPAPTSTLPGLAELGVEAKSMESTAFNFLHRFRKGGHFMVTQGYHEDVKV